MAIGYVDQMAPVVEYCEQMGHEFPDLMERYYQKISDACQQKLWHPLTLLSLDFCQDANASRIDSNGVHTYLGLYDRILLVFQTKINALQLAVIAGRVATALVNIDTTASKAILENLMSKQTDMSSSSRSTMSTASAIYYVQSKNALLLLQAHIAGIAPLSQDELASIHKQIKTNSAILEASTTSSNKKHSELHIGTSAATAASGVDHIVHAAHYEMCLCYYKLVGPPEAYFSAALMFLQYQPPPVPASHASTSTTTVATTTEMTAATFTSTSTTSTTSSSIRSSTDWPGIGVDLCLAALTGEGVYRNLTRVSHICSDLIPIDHPHRWLVPVLQIVAEGRVADLDAALFLSSSSDPAQQQQQRLNSQPILNARLEFVREKLRLLALIHLVFDKNTSDRTIHFNEIAACLQIPVDQVEWAVMRACSVGILKGTIDQVDQTVHVDWVLPRVLDAEQMQAMAVRYGAWAEQVKSINAYMKEQHTVF